MDVTLALVADAANMTADNKLNILGEFNRITAREFPALAPPMVLVLRFDASPAERGQLKNVEIQLLEADGERLFSMQSQFPVPSEGPTLRFMTILSLARVQFQRPGDHAFVILVGGEPKARVPIEVVPAVAEDGNTGESKDG